jgi:hypothetical protein
MRKKPCANVVGPAQSSNAKRGILKLKYTAGLTCKFWVYPVNLTLLPTLPCQLVLSADQLGCVVSAAAASQVGLDTEEAARFLDTDELAAEVWNSPGR